MIPPTSTGYAHVLNCENFRLRALVLMAIAAPAPAMAQASATPLLAVSEPRISALTANQVGVHTPGLALIVAHRGQVIHRAAGGTANIATGTAFTTSTPSYVASVGKMFTALAVLRLVDEGKLTLDTPLGHLLPDAPRYAHGVTIA